MLVLHKYVLDESVDEWVRGQVHCLVAGGHMGSALIAKMVAIGIGRR